MLDNKFRKVDPKSESEKWIRKVDPKSGSENWIRKVDPKSRSEKWIRNRKVDPIHFSRLRLCTYVFIEDLVQDTCNLRAV
jgi:hypothetical protein